MLRWSVLAGWTVEESVLCVIFAVLDAAFSYLFVSKGFKMPSGFRLFTVFYAVFGVGVWGCDL